MDKVLSASAFSEYDFILLVDSSGSMATATAKFESRWLEAKELTIGLAAFASQVDDDGITLITFGAKFDASRDVQDSVKTDAITKLFAQKYPFGSTPLHSALDAAFAKHFSNGKKSIVIVVTDGVPDEPSSVAKAIVNATQKLTDATQLRLLFVQIGDEPSAEAYLNWLDNSLSGAKFDIVNVVTYAQANNLSPPELATRAVQDTH